MVISAGFAGSRNPGPSQRHSRVIGQGMVAAKIHRQEYWAATRPLVGRHDHEIDVNARSAAGFKRHQGESGLSAKEVSKAALHARMEVARSGRDRSIHIMLEKRFEFRFALPIPLFGGGYFLPTEQLQRVGQGFPDRESIWFGKINGAGQANAGQCTREKRLK